MLWFASRKVRFVDFSLLTLLQTSMSYWTTPVHCRRQELHSTNLCVQPFLVSPLRMCVCLDVSLSSDFITGFCGETEADHEMTLDLVRRLNYNFVFCFPYSMRQVRVTLSSVSHTAWGRYEWHIKLLKSPRSRFTQRLLTPSLGMSVVSSLSSPLCVWSTLCCVCVWSTEDAGSSSSGRWRQWWRQTSTSWGAGDDIQTVSSAAQPVNDWTTHRHTCRHGNTHTHTRHYTASFHSTWLKIVSSWPTSAANHCDRLMSWRVPQEAHERVSETGVFPWITKITPYHSPHKKSVWNSNAAK